MPRGSRFRAGAPYDSPVFAYDAAVAERFPAVRAGVLHATGLVNRPSPDELLEEYRGEQALVRARLETIEIAEIPSIVAWRRAFSTFGAKPTQHRSAAEALLRRIAKQGEIPTINTLVDLGNLVSIRYALPVAVFDLAGSSGPTTVRFATGAERFTELGATEAVHPEPGEVIFVDDAGVVSARRWCWRQSAQSAAGPTTCEALIVVEGQHAGAGEDVAAAVRALTSLLERFCRGSQTISLPPGVPG